MNAKPKVSIVIPVYNAEKYLRECLNSVVNQTLKEIEIIIINDGSIDDSFDIINEYAKNDERIIVFNVPNGGEASATNIGLNAATGEYIGRVDADDYISLDMYKEMYELAIAKKLDVLRCDHYKFATTNDEKKFIECLNFSSIFDYLYDVVVCAEEFLDPKRKDYLKIYVPHNTMWSAIHRREFIEENSIRWNPNGRAFADNSFFNLVMTLAKRVMFTKNMYYYYRMDNSNSIIHTSEFYTCDFPAENRFIINEYKRRGLWDNYKDVILRRLVGNLNHGAHYLSFKQIHEYVYAFAAVVKDENLCGQASNDPYITTQLNLLMNDTEEWYRSYINEWFRVSVIMPVYNAENTLRDTLDSLIAQEMKGFEVILIDDGSTDSSLEIMREYQALDTLNRFTIISQKNAGAGAARNRGIVTANGKYLSFLDADDYFYPKMLSIAYDRIRRDEADICLFRAEEYDTVTGKIKKRENYVNESQLPFGYNCSFVPWQIKGSPFQFTNGEAWDKLFSRSFILSSDIKFAEIKGSNDLTFTYTALLTANRITATNHFLIRYNRNHDGAMTSSYDNKWPAQFTAYIRLRENLIQKGRFTEYMEQCFINKCVSSLVWAYETTLQTDEAKRDFYEYAVTKGLKELGILDKDKSYINSQWYRQFDVIQRMIKFYPNYDAFKLCNDLLLEFRNESDRFAWKIGDMDKQGKALPPAEIAALKSKIVAMYNILSEKIEQGISNHVFNNL